MTDYLELALDTDEDEDEAEDSEIQRGAGSPPGRRRPRGTDGDAEETDEAERAVQQAARHTGAAAVGEDVDGAVMDGAVMGGDHLGGAAVGIAVGDAMNSAVADGGWPLTAEDTAGRQRQSGDETGSPPPRRSGEAPHWDAGTARWRGMVDAQEARGGGGLNPGVEFEAIPASALAGPPSRTAQAAQRSREAQRGETPPGARGAEVLYAALRQGERSRVWVQGRRAAAETPAVEAAGRQTDPAELDLAFQRDARRYGGGFTLY